MYYLFMFTLVFRVNTETIDYKQLLTKNSSLDLYKQSTNNLFSLNPYCKICCIDLQNITMGKKCGSHTMCKYKEHKSGPSCQGLVRVYFTDSEKQVLLDIHNTLRNHVAMGVVTEGKPGPQPSASNMRVVEWNNELALIAGRWADQCVYANDICRDVERFPVGQNIARGNLAISNEIILIQKWFDEVMFYNSSRVSRHVMNKHTSKYTQLVWADSYLIGCARAMFQFAQGSSVSYKQHLVCNYGPTGNIPDQPVYKSGTPCTACHEGTSCSTDYESLCVSDESDELQDMRSRGQVIKYLLSYSGCLIFCVLNKFVN